MLKILQARLQQYVNRELPDVQAGFRKGRGTRDQIANICWIMEKAREFQKNIYFCYIDYAKAFDCVDHNKLWKILYPLQNWSVTWLKGLSFRRVGKVTSGQARKFEEFEGPEEERNLLTFIGVASEIWRREIFQLG